MDSWQLDQRQPSLCDQSGMGLGDSSYPTAEIFNRLVAWVSTGLPGFDTQLGALEETLLPQEVFSRVLTSKRESQEEVVC